jgi:hypothetical protein
VSFFTRHRSSRTSCWSSDALRSVTSKLTTTFGCLAEPSTGRRAGDSEICGNGHVSGALDEIPKPVVIALLRAGRSRHSNNHRPFHHAAQLLEGDGESAGRTTTRAGECRMSGEIARLQPEGLPDAAHGRAADPAGLRHVAQTLVGRPLRRRFQRANDDCLDLVVRNLSRGPGSRLVARPVQPIAHKPRAPLCRRLAITVVSPPSAQARMIRARRMCAALRDRCASDASRCRSSAVSINVVMGRPVRMLAPL